MTCSDLHSGHFDFAAFRGAALADFIVFIDD
jgi:hypothetical protein